MEESVVEVFGDRVKQARHLRRMDSREVADQMDWSAPTQTRLEKIERKTFSPPIASKLAAVLRVPLNFLTRQSAPPLAVDDLRFRAPKKTTLQEKNHLVEFARLAGELALTMDDIHNLPPVRLIRFDHEASIPTIALAARQKMGLEHEQPIGHLIHAIERLGVVVVVRTAATGSDEVWDKSGDASIEKPEKGERHFGYSCWVGPYRDRPLVTLRAIDSWERTRWTVAHELGHLLLHRTELPDDAELTASRFASELLAPIEVIRSELSRHVTLADLIPVKVKWGISIGALIRHLRDTESISIERSDALSRQLYTRLNPTTGRTWGLDEPGWNERIVERPRLLSRWAERCFGTASAPAIASTTQFFPADLLGMMLASQRTPSGRAPKTPEAPTPAQRGSVVSLSDRRAARNGGSGEESRKAGPTR